MINIAKPPETFEDSKCGRCTALCCHYFALEIDAPEEPDDFENLRWYVLHHDVAIFVDDGDWYLQIFRKCEWLDGHRCGRYDDRPQICRDYENDACDYDGVESDEVFRTIEELESYRDRWVADYEARRERKRAARRKSGKKKKGKDKGKGKARDEAGGQAKTGRSKDEPGRAHRPVGAGKVRLAPGKRPGRPLPARSRPAERVAQADG